FVLAAAGPPPGGCAPDCPLPSGLLGKLGDEAVAVGLVLRLQLLQGPQQLPGRARVVADALALLDDQELTFLVTPAVSDRLLGLVQQSLFRGSRHAVGTQTVADWFADSGAMGGPAPGGRACRPASSNKFHFARIKPAVRALTARHTSRAPSDAAGMLRAAAGD